MSSRVILWSLLGIGSALLICEAQQILALQRYRIEDAERTPTLLPDLAFSALEQSGLQDGDVHIIALVRSGNTVRSYRLSYESDSPNACDADMALEAVRQPMWMPAGEGIEFDELAEAPAIAPVSLAGSAGPGF